MQVIDKVNCFISIDEHFSESFTYDYYVKGIRQLIRWLAYSQGIGRRLAVPLNLEEHNLSPLLLLVGHSNRAAVRYPYISKLLTEFGDVSERKDIRLEASLYYKYLYRRYKDQSFFSRLKGRNNCLIKVKRTLALYDYILSNGSDFSGFTDDGNRSNVHDYPLCFSFSCFSKDILELDGSHRRSVAYFCGHRIIQSHVIDITELESWLSVNGDASMYFYKHWELFKDTLIQISKK
jgi:hypothetical protein